MPIRWAVSLLLLAGLAIPGQANGQVVARLRQHGRPCTFDFEKPDTPDCIRVHKSGTLFINPKYLRKLTFDDNGFAGILSDQKQWMYVNRQGDVIISGVASMDNGPDTFHEGLVRVVRNGTYGFADKNGVLVVPAIFDGAYNFEGGVAQVCKQCRKTCDEGGEHCSFTDGHWFRVDARGRIAETAEP